MMNNTVWKSVLLVALALVSLVVCPAALLGVALLAPFALARTRAGTIAGLAVMGGAGGMASAQGVGLSTGGILTPGGTGWLLAVAGVAAFGYYPVREFVALVKARFPDSPEKPSFLRGNAVIALTFASALGLTLFLFQPGLLDIAAFKLLPAWEGVLAVAALITIRASGGLDLAKTAAPILSSAVVSGPDGQTTATVTTTTGPATTATTPADGGPQ